MSVFILSIGLVVRRGDRTWRLERHLADGTLVFADQINGCPHTLSVAELWRQLNDKRLSIVSGDVALPDDSKALPLVTDWSSLAPELQAAGNRQLEYVREMQRLGLSRGMRRAIKLAIEKRAQRTNDAHPPGDSSVMRWMRLLDAAHGSPLVLVARRVLPKRAPRKAQLVLEMAQSALVTHYCSRARPTLAATKLHIDRVLQAKVSTGELPADLASISVSTLRRLKEEIDPYQRDVARFGPEYARNRWRYSLRGTSATRAMQRYEVDHTVLDLVAVCDVSGLPLGRPTLTVVVDAYSGYVVGFYLSFWGTGLATSFCALKVALSPKDDYVQGAGLTQRWLGMGLFELLVMDNGLEFHSPQFRRVALHLGIDLLYCAVRQPWLKPHVERTLGSIQGLLPSAGRVRKSLNNEIPLKPTETAAITFSALCHGVLKALVDIHPMQVNERKLARPYDLFAESLDLLPPPAFPTSTEALDIMVAPSKVLTVGNEGVVSDYLRFNSPDLQQLRRRTSERFKTTVKFNPEDLSQVYVQDVQSKGWLAVPCCWPEYAADLSLVQHRAIRTHARQALSQRNAQETLARAKAELADLWQSSAVKGRRLKGAQLRSLAKLTSSHALRPSVAGPTTAPPKVPQLVVREDLSVPARDIPDFDTFQM